MHPEHESSPDMAMKLADQKKIFPMPTCPFFREWRREGWFRFVKGKEFIRFAIYCHYLHGISEWLLLSVWLIVVAKQNNHKTIHPKVLLLMS